MATMSRRIFRLRPKIAYLLQQNLDQNEETAQTAEQSARKLLERVQQEAGSSYIQRAIFSRVD